MRGRFYTYRYTVTIRMIPALRWPSMRAINCEGQSFINCEGQSHKTVSTDHNFRRERRAEADSNRGSSAYQPNALPLGQTGSPHDSVHRPQLYEERREQNRGTSAYQPNAFTTPVLNKPYGFCGR